MGTTSSYSESHVLARLVNKYTDIPKSLDFLSVGFLMKHYLHMGNGCGGGLFMETKEPGFISKPELILTRTRNSYSFIFDRWCPFRYMHRIPCFDRSKKIARDIHIYLVLYSKTNPETVFRYGLSIGSKTIVEHVLNYVHRSCLRDGLYTTLYTGNKILFKLLYRHIETVTKLAVFSAQMKQGVTHDMVTELFGRRVYPTKKYPREDITLMICRACKGGNIWAINYALSRIPIGGSFNLEKVITACTSDRSIHDRSRPDQYSRFKKAISLRREFETLLPVRTEVKNEIGWRDNISLKNTKPDKTESLIKFPTFKREEPRGFSQMEHLVRHVVPQIPGKLIRIK